MKNKLLKKFRDQNNNLPKKLLRSISRSMTSPYIYLKGEAQSIRSSRCINYAILPHQKPTLLFYHIILQYPIYQMFYIFITSLKYYFLIYLPGPSQDIVKKKKHYYSYLLQLLLPSSSPEIHVDLLNFQNLFKPKEGKRNE